MELLALFKLQALRNVPWASLPKARQKMGFHFEEQAVWTGLQGICPFIGLELRNQKSWQKVKRRILMEC